MFQGLGCGHPGEKRGVILPATFFHDTNFCSTVHTYCLVFIFPCSYEMSSPHPTCHKSYLIHFMYVQVSDNFRMSSGVLVPEFLLFYFPNTTLKFYS